MLVIGITGTLGAGKGTVVEYLVSKYEFCHFSVREYLKNKLLEANIEPNRDNFTLLANRLREENSPSFLIEELYKKAQQINGKAIIESIRTVGEITKLKENSDFYLLAVDADLKERYTRITHRKSETDAISYEKFVADEARELNSALPTQQNLVACIEKADFVVNNNGNIVELQRQIDVIMSKITKNG